MKLEFNTLEEVLEFSNKFNITNPITKSEKPVSIVEINGKKGVRIRTIDEDFVINPFLESEACNWDEAMIRLESNHVKGISKKQYAIISAYHDEVNQAIQKCGGYILTDEWSTTEYYGCGAWFYYGYRGRLNDYVKSCSCSVRSLLA